MINGHFDTTKLLLLGQLLACEAMTGIIWMVQVVTYPQFLEVDATSFPNYHERYSARMTWVVGPLMVLELGLAIVATFHFRDSPDFFLIATASFLVVVLWAITFFIQVPQHSSLADKGWDRTLIHSLISGNWIRTALWTIRLGILGWVMLGSNQPSAV